MNYLSSSDPAVVSQHRLRTAFDFLTVAITEDRDLSGERVLNG
jgi:hypothetical protein